jgi:ABC-type oligopeptide transport system substrate-binding subunit
MGRGALAALSLLALTAGLASASPAKQGGIFRLGTSGSSTQIDPQVAYVTTAWWLEYATAAKLYNYPDKRGQAGGLLQPEVASGFTVSRDARTYTFTIRKGFRFSDGTPVTAKNFAYAIKRATDPDLASPAAAFIPEVTSAQAKGGKLVIRLNRSAPSLLTRLAMPFFQATSTKLPLKTEVTTGYPSAGPYYFAKNVVNELTSLRRNPYWHGDRPRHLAGVDVQWNLDQQTAYQQTLANQLDEGPIPAAEATATAERFGVNKTRFWKMPINCMGFIPFNLDRGIFAKNPAMRKAVNWALDRTEYFSGNFAITPWTHLLTPLTPGAVTAKNKQPYGVRANIAKARKLAAGHFRDGRITVAYRSSGTVITLQQAEIVRDALIRLGFDPAKIEMKGLSGAQIYDAMGVKGNPYDMGVSMGWCSDYPDDTALGGALFYAQYPRYQDKIAAAAKLPPAQRAKALGELDIQLMKNVAPLAPMGYYNNLFLFSKRVDPRSLVYSAVYQDFSIPALSLK